MVVPPYMETYGGTSIYGKASLVGFSLQTQMLYNTYVHPCASNRAIFDDVLTSKMSEGEMCVGVWR